MPARTNLARAPWKSVDHHRHAVADCIQGARLGNSRSLKLVTPVLVSRP